MATPETGQYMPPAGDRRTPFSSPYYSNPSASNAKFNPTMAVVIIVLIGGCFLLGFISVFVRKCMTADSAGEEAASTSSRGCTAKQRGLDKAAVDALPLVRSADLEEKDDLECPVCLMEFEPEDSLRLLPACKHLFHQECIDAWFDAHSTCPLCRASLTAQPGADAGASTPAAPVETVVEVSENGDSDNDMRESAPSLEEMRTDVATPSVTISGEDERNSARGILSRNSQSFKSAVRGTTALEKAASLGAPGTSKLPTAPGLRKPTRTPSSTGIRRSSTDLIALRNLLSSDATNSSYSLNRSRSVAPSTSWFARPRGMDPGPRGRENWSNIDLEFGKPSTSKGETSSAAGAERAWSDRWSLASLRGAMFPLSRSSSDVTARAT